MHATNVKRRWSILRNGLVAAGVAAMLAGEGAIVSAQHDHGQGAGGAMWDCDIVATPEMGQHPMHGTGSTPVAGAMLEAEFDQLYIDMMIPHHDSIIALAQAALPNLTDPRLVTIAESIITAQEAENEQMRAWRDAWYGSPDPDTSEHGMTMMLEAMPVGTMDEMMREMDPAWQVSTFCTASNPDVAFARQAIRHHQMAVEVSEIAIERAVHPELVEFAAGVIEVQQAEIDELTSILNEIAPVTPAS